jgi:hypothetical protein
LIAQLTASIRQTSGGQINGAEPVVGGWPYRAGCA